MAGMRHLLWDTKGRRKQPGRPVPEARPADWRLPPPHPYPTHPESGLPPLGPDLTASPLCSQQPLPPRLSAHPQALGVGSRGWAERIPGPEERTRARRTPHPNSRGRRVPGDHPAKTKRQGGRGSLAGGEGAVPRRRGDGTPPWWRQLS